MNLIYRYRVKDKHTKLLDRMARGVNAAWNFCNELQRSEFELQQTFQPAGVLYDPKFYTWFDLANETTGMTKRFGIHSSTLNDTCHYYAKSRKQAKRRWLRWRSNSKSLGWIPFKGRHLKHTGDTFRFFGHDYTVWYSRAIPDGAKICDGSCFSKSVKGHWFLDVCLRLGEAPKKEGAAVGIDLGLKALATLSDGTVVDNPRITQAYADRLAMARRAHKARLVKTIYTRMVDTRHDFLHKETTKIAEKFAYIGVGNVNPTVLGQTKLASSIYDASWSAFRAMLSYKATAHGCTYAEVEERLTTQTCSACGALPESRPKGIAGLAKRRWICSECGQEHDRDVNAALNILARHGHVSPAVGASGR